MSRAVTFPKGINQHVDSLVFIIPHRDAHAREAFEVLWDTYFPGRFARLEIYARDATVFEAIKRDGLTVNVMEMGMYYMDSHRGRDFTQDGYVLYQVHSREERQDMGFFGIAGTD
ncbi:hypothetical protein BGZ97_003102 [Linnemannia gamsii]|uniref:Uncharacterized protein n=1 Tax=Linnemannia gamsii TaxID=64522 RepID=A0A9P6QYG9_9FUNG|nr:hypothetical protein BGZ97_003102 [Linnemannia gamsii]